MGVIVFCEDDAGIQKLIRSALRSSAHIIHMANDGVEGLALIERLRPTVVFADISMPRMDGVQLCEALKARPDLADIPFVFMTASIHQQKAEACLEEGRRDYLIKPFNLAELRAKVERYASQDAPTPVAVHPA